MPFYKFEILLPALLVRQAVTPNCTPCGSVRLTAAVTELMGALLSWGKFRPLGSFTPAQEYRLVHSIKIETFSYVWYDISTEITSSPHR